MLAPIASAALRFASVALLCLAMLAAGFSRASIHAAPMQAASVEIGGVAVPICSADRDGAPTDPAHIGDCCEFCLQGPLAGPDGPAAAVVPVPPQHGTRQPPLRVAAPAAAPRARAGTIRGPPLDFAIA